MTVREPTGNDGDRPATSRQVDELITVVNHLAYTNSWRKIGRVALVGLVAGLLILSASNVFLYLRTVSDASCIRRWAVATSVRSAVLTDGRRDLDDATNALILTAIPDPNTSRAQQIERFNSIAQTYREASAKYRELLATNPVPPAPAFNC